MNITKIEVLDVLSHFPNKWFRAKQIAKQLKQPDTATVNRISNVLFRLRHHPEIERKCNSPNYKYRFCGAIRGHPTLIPRVTKPKAIKSGFDGYSFIEPLTGPSEGYCELCECFTDILFTAEKEGGVVHLCKMHGEAVNTVLGNYGGAWQ